MGTRKASLSHTTDAPDRLVSSNELHGNNRLPALVPWDRTTTYKLIRAGKFSRPIHITSALRAWRWSTLRAWMDEREAHPIEQRAYFKAKAPSTEKAGR